jgi:hypothetical protein
MSDYRLDERLQNYGKLIATMVDLEKWRNRLKPRAEAWRCFFRRLQKFILTIALPIGIYL